MKDAKGNVLSGNPDEGLQGIVSWSSLKTRAVHGRVLQIDGATLRTRNFACENVYIICGINGDPFELGLGFLGTGGLTGYPQGCPSVGACECDGGGCYGGGGDAIGWAWGSYDSSIASLYSGGDTSQATYYGNSVGSTSYYMSANDFYGCGGSGAGPIAAKPTVTIQVQNGFVSMAGNGLVVLAGPGGLSSTAITAVGNPGGGSYSWGAGPNLQISVINSANASVSGTAPSASGGDTYTSVTYAMNGQSGAASVRFTVLNPTSLQAANYPGGSQSTTPYSDGINSGYITSLTYYVYDQFSPPSPIALPGMPLTEILSTLSNPYGAQFYPADGTPVTAQSDPNGTMRDYLYAYGPGGLPQGFSAIRSQNLTANGFGFTPAQQQTYTSTYATVSTQTLHR